MLSVPPNLVQQKCCQELDQRKAQLIFINRPGAHIRCIEMFTSDVLALLTHVRIPIRDSNNEARRSNISLSILLDVNIAVQLAFST